MSGQRDIDALQRRLREFAAARDWERFHDPKSLAGSVVIEAAELLECFQWLTTEESQSVGDQRDAIASEMADVLIYLLRLADVLDIDLVSSADAKMDTNEARFPIPN